MAAPSNKYFSPDTMTFRKTGYADKQHLLALRGEYALTDAQVKDLFKIDKLRPLTKGANSVFVGSINPNQDNMRYHNASRLGGVKIGNYEFLKDAGLNRKGDASVITVLNTQTSDYNSLIENYPPRINDIRLFYWLYSPIYNATTGALIYASKDGSMWTQIGSYGSLSADASTVQYIDNPSYVDVSGNMYFKATITNDEGVFTSDIYTALIKMALSVMKYDSSQASYAYLSGTNRNVYRDTLEFLDYANNPTPTRLYKDENTPPTNQDSGYFVFGDYWYQYGYSGVLGYMAILDKGLCEAGSWPSGDPNNITHDYEQVDYSGFDRDYLENAELEVNSGNYEYGSLYLDHVVDYENSTDTVYAYSDSGHTTLAGQGYYVCGEMVLGITRELQVDNLGVIVWDTGWL